MCLSIELKESSRVRLCKILVGIMACCVIFAKLISHHGFRYRKDFRLYTSLVEGYDAGALPLLLIATGIATSLVNLYGIYVSFRSMYPSLRQRMVSQLGIYTKVIYVDISLLIVCCFFCFLQQSLVDDTFKNGFLSALKRYRTEPKIKEDIDQLQLKFKCCGNEKYTDWFQVNWISDEYIDVNLPDEQKKMRNGNYETDDVPFSCCNLDANRPCVRRNVHDNLKNFNYIYQKDLTIFKDGCRPVLVQKADHLVAFIFGVVLVLIFLELSVAVLVRHLVTSVQAALDLGDPTATTNGFMFKALLMLESKKADECATNNSAAPSTSPSTVSSTTTTTSVALPPTQPQPTTLSIPPLRRSTALPPQPLPLSQTARRSSQRPSSHQVAPPPSPTRPDITSDQVTVDMNDPPFARPTYMYVNRPEATNPVVSTTLAPAYARPTIMTTADDGGSGIQRVDPRSSMSPSTSYDQQSSRMPRSSALEP